MEYLSSNYIVCLEKKCSFNVTSLLLGIIRDSETRYNLLNPTFFIFGEKDHTISLEQVNNYFQILNSFMTDISAIHLEN